MLIAGNAGHYPGADPGACGAQITEAELAKRYVERINSYLENVGINTIFIQEDDLGLICDIANNNNADLFYSLHFNSATNTSANGTEVFYSAGSTNGEILARCIQNQLVSTLGTYDRGTKTNRLYVTANTDMPAVLIEVGFISNADEEQMLLDREDDACRAIARGITDAILEMNGGASNTNPTETAAEIPTDLPPGMVSKYFSVAEVSCHCCGVNGAQPLILQFLDTLREKIGRPLYASCVYRCPKHNREVRGVENSSHVTGLAADVYCDGLTVDQLADIAENLGADGVGRYYGDEFVHVDVRDGWTGTKYRW